MVSYGVVVGAAAGSGFGVAGCGGKVGGESGYGKVVATCCVGDGVSYCTAVDAVLSSGY